MEPQTRRFDQGALICRQGTAADEMFVLRSGELEVIVNPESTHPPDRGEIFSHGTRVALLHAPGAVFGESDDFQGIRSASIVAKSTCEIDCIPLGKDGLKGVLMNNPTLGLQLARTAAGRLQNVNQGVALAASILEGIRHSVDAHFLAFYQLCEKIATRCGDVPQAVAIHRWAKQAFSYRRAQQILIAKNKLTDFLKSLDSLPGGNTLKLPRGTSLFRQGERTDDFYILRQGAMEVQLNGQIIGIVRQGEIVGEMNMLLDEHRGRSATVVAARFCKLAKFPGGQFASLVKARPMLIVHTVQVLHERIRNTNRVICNFQENAGKLLHSLEGGTHSCAGDTEALLEKLQDAGDALQEEYAEAEKHRKDIAQSSLRHIRELNAPKTLLTRGLSYQKAYVTMGMERIAGNLRELLRRIVETKAPSHDSTTLEALGGDLQSLLSDGALEAVMDMRQQDVASHSVRTGLYALSVADRLHFTGEQSMDLAVGVLLHDAGMMMLSQDELDTGQQQVEDHVGRFAMRVIEKLPWLNRSHRSAILQHHETMDRKGYPAQPAPEEILLSARILGPCNAFDLLRQAGAPFDEACAGIFDHPQRYDHRVLAAFKDVLEDVQSGTCQTQEDT